MLCCFVYSSLRNTQLTAASEHHLLVYPVSFSAYNFAPSTAINSPFCSSSFTRELAVDRPSLVVVASTVIMAPGNICVVLLYDFLLPTHVIYGFMQFF